MFISLLFLFLTTLIGTFAASRLPLLRGAAERLGVGMAIALILQLWLPFVVAQSFGVEGGSLLSLVLLLVGCILIFVKGRARFSAVNWRSWPARLKSETYWLHGVFLVLLVIFMGYLFYTHSLCPTEEGLSSAGISWEDQSGHAMFTSSFLFSDNLSHLEYPTYSGWPLGYPFLSDLLPAILIQFGLTMGESFWLSAWYASACFLLVAWVILRNWFGSPRVASVGLILLLCAGGCGGFTFLAELLNGMPWTEAVMARDYVNDWDLQLHYHNVLTGILLPMRTSLFGMAIALPVLLLMGRAVENGVIRFEVLTAGLLTGFLPLVNAHSFLVANWCALSYALLFVSVRDFRQWKNLALWFAVPMLVNALPQLLWTRSQMVISETPFIRVHLGWMFDPSQRGWLEYWISNGGLRVPLAFVCWGVAPPRIRKFTAPLLALLIIGNVLAFQPFAYDNVKLFTFADIAIAGFTAWLLFQLWRRGRGWIFLIIPLFVGFVFSGVLSIWRELRLENVIVTWEGIQFSEIVRRESPPRSVFLTGSQVTHPIQVLTGRPMVLGFKNWLVQHGIPIAEREADVRTMFEGGEGADELLRKYKVDFVVVGPAEREEFKNLSESFIGLRAANRFQVGDYTLYDIREWRLTQPKPEPEAAPPEEESGLELSDEIK